MLLRVSSFAFCVLPGPQCAAACYSCNKAGAGKCDRCDDGYGVTPLGTCTLVRLLQALGVAACTRMRACHCARATASLTRPSCVRPGSQCAAGCLKCDTAGASKCDQCDGRYKLIKNGTCAPVRLLRALLALGAAACMCLRPCHAHVLLRVSPFAFCVLPGSQCAAGCYSCDTAGAGKCDDCVAGYILITNGTCAPVRLLPARALRLARACAAAESHQAFCLLPGPQCTAAHCYSCGTAGAGKCDIESCDDGYVLTASGTCVTKMSRPPPSSGGRRQRGLRGFIRSQQ